MVLSDLGKSIQGALKKLNEKTIVDDETFQSILKDICAALLESDVNVKLVMEMRQQVQKRVLAQESSKNRHRLIQTAVFDELVSMLTPEKQSFVLKKGKSNVIVFVGLQGSGKTTSIGKVAYYYQKKGFKTCMVCADTFRAGAFDQLKQNAVKLRIPFYGSYTEADPVRIATEGVAQFRKEKYEVIIVDTSGRHKQESALFEEMQQVVKGVQPDDVVFVMDSTIGQAAGDQAKAFQSAVPLGSVIITKLDGHAKGGGALSAVSATNSPISFYGTGEHFSDFEKFVPASFVSRLLGMGDMRGLMEHAQESGALENSTEMLAKMQKGEFTLRDMYSQFQTVLKMGPMDKMMSMIPGMEAMMGGNKINQEEGTKRLKKFIYMMDSMTDKELDGIVTLSESRQMRIVKGSGCQENDMMMLMRSHKQFSTYFGKMGKSGMLGHDPKAANRMGRNPNQMMQQMAKNMDPKMMQQMGGTQGMMQMMKKMQNMDPNEMMKMMSNMPGSGFPQ